MNNKYTNRGTSNKQKIVIGSIIGIAVAAIAVILVLVNQTGDKEHAVYDDLRNQTAPSPSGILTEEIIPPQQSSQTNLPFTDIGLQTPDREIDFAKLTERNPDIIAWISVDGTEIDYPIVKSKDNVDYLKKDIDGEENVNGSIFMDMANNVGLQDKNTVYYGHNMKNGSMFAGLHKFEDKDFFNQNREVKVYTPEGMRVYEIVAAYLTDDKNVLYERDYNNDTVYKEYIDSIFNNRDMKANLLDKDVTVSDRILTLSTCERGQDDKRYLVQAVLKTNEPSTQATSSTTSASTITVSTPSN